MTEDSSRHKAMPDILLVEDNPLHLRLVKSMLADIWPPNEVAAVRHARSLEEAVDAIRNDPPDCVLLDLVLPDADGIDSLNGIRAADPLVPIVILSAHENAAMARQAINGGAQDYLVKGAVSPEDLERSVAFAMGRKDHERRKVAETPGVTPWPENQPTAEPSKDDIAVPESEDGEANRLGTAIIDAEGFFRFVEPEVGSALGRSLESIATQPAADLVHPNDAAGWKKLMEGEPGPTDIRFLHPSGHPIYTRVSAVTLESVAEGDPVVMATFVARSEVGTVSSGAYVVMSDWG